MMIILFLIPTTVYNNLNTWFSNLLGGTDQLLSALLTTMVLDFLTKTLAPIPERKYTFIDCYCLIWKKIIILFTVAISNTVDILTDANNTVRNATIVYYIIINAISFFASAEKLENVPKFLRKTIEEIKNKIDKH